MNTVSMKRFSKSNSQKLFSSEPFGSLIENEVESKVEDGVILKLEEHDDAVYRNRFYNSFFGTNE